MSSAADSDHSTEDTVPLDSSQPQQNPAPAAQPQAVHDSGFPDYTKGDGIITNDEVTKIREAIKDLASPSASVKIAEK